MNETATITHGLGDEGGITVEEHLLPGPVTLRDPMAVAAPSGSGVLLGVISRVAADPGVDLTRVEKLLELYERMTAVDAERQFTQAMAQFKCDPPRIVKDKLVSFDSERTGGTTQYRHATLGGVCDAVIPGLALVGISHRWELEQKDGRIRVTCVLTHRAGHSQRTSMDGAPDSSGKKNPVQQAASTVTYLQRYTLLAAVGLGTDEQDDDGEGGSKGAAGNASEPPPEGYASWRADMDAVDSFDKLVKAWNKSNPLYRAYVALHDARWWREAKAKFPGEVAHE